MEFILGWVVREGSSEEVTTGLRFDGLKGDTYGKVWWSLLATEPPICHVFLVEGKRKESGL